MPGLLMVISKEMHGRDIAWYLAPSKLLATANDEFALGMVAINASSSC